MKNITVSIGDEAYRQARIWSAERGISLSKIVAYLLEHLPTHPVANRRFPAPANRVPQRQVHVDGVVAPPPPIPEKCGP